MEENEIEEPGQEEQRLVIYSKTAILVFSIFFSPIAGGALLMINLRSIGKKTEGGLILVFSIAYQFIAGIFLRGITPLPKLDPAHPDIHPLIKPLVFSLIAGIIGGGILAEYFFRKYFPDDNYEPRSIWRALFVVLLIAIPLNLLFGI